MSGQHSEGLSWERICRRAGGRRHYNSVRQYCALQRRAEVARLWCASPDARRWQARAAQELGVHPSTISRDVQALLDELNRTRRCPLCGRE
jgi:hypothetical protein